MFFSVIRSKGGFNNNPTALQFESAYKRLLTYAIKMISIEANNCVGTKVPMDSRKKSTNP